MKGYSQIDKMLRNWAEDFDRRSKMIPAPPFPEDLRTPEIRKARMERSAIDYRYFDKVYFPAETYKQGFAPPAKFQYCHIPKIIETPGVDIIAGPRKFAKTATGRKKLLQMLTAGNINFASTFSEDIDVAQMWIRFLYIFLTRGRIKEDYKPEIESYNKNELIYYITAGPNPGRRTVKPFSLGRSLRGQLEVFERPEIAIGDDIETKDSSMNPDNVRDRIDRITEAFESLDNTKASFTIFANNFDERCATNVLLKEQDDGVLTDDYRVHVFKAWSGRSLWPKRFPAKSEAELKSLLKPRDEANWQANYQQNPIPPDGYIFKREYYQEWNALPKDCQGVIYTDQNLAKKSKGDTTAISKFLYSRKTGKYYLADARCKSYSKSAELFTDLLRLHDRKVRGIAFDGNVSQESYWSEILDGFVAIADGSPSLGDLPRILKSIAEFKRYRVDDLSINLQLIYERGLLLFPSNFAKTEEGSRFLSQFFAFAGKKKGKKDDAPDSLICALQYIFERKLARKSHYSEFKPVIVRDVYSM